MSFKTDKNVRPPGKEALDSGGRTFLSCSIDGSHQLGQTFFNALLGSPQHSIPT